MIDADRKWMQPPLAKALAQWMPRMGPQSAITTCLTGNGLSTPVLKSWSEIL